MALKAVTVSLQFYGMQFHTTWHHIPEGSTFHNLRKLPLKPSVFIFDVYKHDPTTPCKKLGLDRDVAIFTQKAIFINNKIQCLSTNQSK